MCGTLLNIACIPRCVSNSSRPKYVYSFWYLAWKARQYRVSIEKLNHYAIIRESRRIWRILSRFSPSCVTMGFSTLQFAPMGNFQAIRLQDAWTLCATVWQRGFADEMNMANHLKLQCYTFVIFVFKFSRNSLSTPISARSFPPPKPLRITIRNFHYILYPLHTITHDPRYSFAYRPPCLAEKPPRVLSLFYSRFDEPAQKRGTPEQNKDGGGRHAVQV